MLGFRPFGIDAVEAQPLSNNPSRQFSTDENFVNQARSCPVPSDIGELETLYFEVTILHLGRLTPDASPFIRTVVKHSRSGTLPRYGQSLSPEFGSYDAPGGSS